MRELSGEEVAKRERDAGFRGRLVAASADVMLETQARCRAGGFVWTACRRCGDELRVPFP